MTVYVYNFFIFPILELLFGTSAGSAEKYFTTVNIIPTKRTTNWEMKAIIIISTAASNSNIDTLKIIFFNIFLDVTCKMWFSHITTNHGIFKTPKYQFVSKNEYEIFSPKKFYTQNVCNCCNH